MSQHLRPALTLKEMQAKQREKTAKVRQLVQSLDQDLPFERSNFDGAAEKKALEYVSLVASSTLHNCIDVKAIRRIPNR